MDPIRRGDIWTVTLVGHPKPRPGLIVSIDAVNDLCPDVLIVPLTSHPGPLRVRLTGDLGQTGLRLESFAKCESVGPIYKTRLKRRIGSLSPSDWTGIETCLKRVLGMQE